MPQMQTFDQINLVIKIQQKIKILISFILDNSGDAGLFTERVGEFP